MIEIPAAFRTMPRWWHDGTDWLDALPDLVADQCARWDLTPEPDVRHGSNALVVPVRRGEERLALRLSPPGDDVAREATTLQFWDGRGTVRLLDADPRTAGTAAGVDQPRSVRWPSSRWPTTATDRRRCPAAAGRRGARRRPRAPARSSSRTLPGWPERWSALGRSGL